MADTRADVTVPAGTWVDLYSSTSIAVGTAVTVTNKGSYSVLLAEKATEPSDDTVGYPLFPGANGNSAVVEASASGLWAYAVDGTGKVLVQE